MRQGVIGDVVLVNGTPKPFLRVARRRYRFRILNGSNARVYRLKRSIALPSTVIGSEVGFPPHPVETQELENSPSERYSVLVTFGRLLIGTRVVLRDVMRFDVTNPLSARSRRGASSTSPEAGGTRSTSTSSSSRSSVAPVGPGRRTSSAPRTP